MACEIAIEGAFGIGDPPTKFRVIGTVQDCPQGVDGDSVIVGLSCRSADGPFTEVNAQVDHLGRWQAMFFAPQPGCGCNAEVFATARCAHDDGCEADLFVGTITCVSCPGIDFGDDVGLPHVDVECDTDGTALVSISFGVVNTTQQLIHVQVNCGPGGVPVSGGAVGFTPGASGKVNVVCRYDPAVTPNPTPFIEFLDSDFNPQGCPPVPILVGQLPDCGGGCPSTAAVEVSTGTDEIVDIDNVLCLPTGDYTVTVVEPPTGAGLAYFWSIDGVSQSGVTGSDFTVTVDAGQTVDVTVVVDIPACPPLSTGVTLEGCIQDCPDEVELEVRTSGGQLVDLDQPCLQAGTYTVNVLAPSGPGWDFEWTVNGVLDTSTTAASRQIDVSAGNTIAVTVTAHGKGCPTHSADVTLQGCDDGDGDGNGGDGGGGFGCAGLLITAVSMLILGAILTAIGVCTGATPLIVVGSVTLLLGILLFALWMIFCRRFTSCDVMRKVRCLLRWLILIAFVLGLILALTGSFACGIAVAAAAAPWAVAEELLDDVMALRECRSAPCILPDS